MGDREKRGVMSLAMTGGGNRNRARKGDSRRTILVKRSTPPCPECGGRLVRMGYCFSCISCGWGGCS